MFDGLSGLALAVGAFVGSHLALSSPGPRRRLAGLLGEWPFLGLYSAVALALFAWAVAAYGAAPEVALWRPPTALRYLSITVMGLATVLVVVGYTQPNPTAVFLDRLAAAEGPRGITKITRHPAMWGVALWALVHVLATGNVASLILFGGFGGLALAGAAHIDRRRRLTGGEAWRRLEAETSNVPFLALVQGRTRLDWREIGGWRLALAAVVYVAMLFGHQWATGVSPLAA